MIRLNLSGFAAAQGARCVAAICLWGLLALTTDSTARDVVGIRYFSAPEYTRVVLDMSGPGSFEVRRVTHPDRLAINIVGAGVNLDSPVSVADGLVQGIRLNHGNHRAQIVIDLGRAAQFRSFSLPAIQGRSDRIVVDVLRPAMETSKSGDRELQSVDEPRRTYTVIIDPGHGGLDPGATRGGLAEKTVVLAVAREMARLINTLPGYRAEMTRRGDYGLELWQRVQFARDKQGDLFVSVHCNTHSRADVAGAEVYFLSQQGASDRESQELADYENAAQLVGLDPRDDNDEMVMGILMDLQANQVLRESARLSWHLLDAIEASGAVERRTAKQASFRVLKNLAMPSALVELAYMSNGHDLAVLQDRRGRQDLAAAMVRGLVTWRGDTAAGAQLAGGKDSAWTGRYQVRRGDSLWDLAHDHGTTVREISRHNNLRSGLINVGQELRLPEVVQGP